MWRGVFYWPRGHANVKMKQVLRNVSKTTPSSVSQYSIFRITAETRWNDTIYLTAIGLSPGGSNTVHIYTQTIHRTIQNNQYTEQHNNWKSASRAPSWLVIPWHLPYKWGKSTENLTQTANTNYINPSTTEGILRSKLLPRTEGFLGAVAKFRKATSSFVMSVCPHGTTRLPVNGFSWNFIFEYFSKICRENSSFIKSYKTDSCFTRRPVHIYDTTSPNSS
jgi:hypothetical protein